MPRDIDFIKKDVNAKSLDGMLWVEDKINSKVLLGVYKKLAGELFSVGIDMQEVYAQYSKSYLEWIVPPIILPQYLFDSRPIQYELHYSSAEGVFSNYRAGLISVIEKGSPQEVADFAATSALQVLQHNATTSWLFNSENCCSMLKNGRVIGIKAGKVVGGPAPDITGLIPDAGEWITLPRGVTKLNTFDFLDQVKMWMESHRELFAQYDSVEYALAILKLRGGWETTYGFQQLMYKGRIPEPKEQLRYTEELLDRIRDMWDSDELGVASRYVELCRLVQHLGIPHKDWVRIFRIRTRGEGAKLTWKQADDICRGYDEFIGYFLAQQSKEKFNVNRSSR